jgi:5-hydroxyisourate hydrolase-like protein (transthyretin family)
MPNHHPLRALFLPIALLLTILLPFSGPVQVDAESWSNTQPKGTVSGHIVDPSGMPVNIADLAFRELTGKTGGTIRGLTNGTYSWSLRVGTYTLTASAPGFVTSSSQVVTVTEGQTVTADFSLARVASPGTVRGTVTDSTTGIGLTGIDIRLSDHAGLTNETTRSGSDGSFTFAAVPPGIYILGAGDWSFPSIDYVTASQTVTVVAGLTVTEKVQMMPKGKLGVRITAENGGSVQGASVSISHTTGSGTSSFTVLMDGSGTQLVNLEPGIYSVRAMAGAHKASQAQTVTISSGQTASLSFVLTPSPSGTLMGQVTDDLGAPVNGAWVTVMETTGASITQSLTLTTGADGQYIVEKLAVGSYTVWASASGYGGFIIVEGGDGISEGNVRRRVSLTAEQTTTADLRLNRTVLVTIRIVDADGKAVPGAYLVQYDNRLSIVAKGDGSYLLSMEAGPFTAAAGAPGYSSSASQTFHAGAVGDSPTVTFTLKKVEGGGLITGKAIDHKTGRPVPNVTVSLQDIAAIKSDVLPAVTTADGSYSIHDVAPGTYQVNATAETYTVAAQRLTLAPNATATVDLDVYESGTMAVLVVDEQGKPVPFATVLVTGPNGYSLPYHTDEKGSLRAGLQSDTYTVTARAPHLLTKQAQTVVVPHGQTATVTITMEAAQIGTVKGRISDAATGAGATRIVVSLTDPITHAKVGEVVTTDSSGTFELLDVLAGTYELSLDSDNYVSNGPVSVTVPADQTVTIDESVRKGGLLAGTVMDGLKHPLGDAIITAKGHGGSRTIKPMAGGTYREVLEAGTYTLNVTATGFLPSATRTVQLGFGAHEQANFALKLPATLKLTKLVQTYDGAPKPVVVIATPDGAASVSVLYGVHPSAPTAPGEYTVTALLFSDEYEAAPVTGKLVIAPQLVDTVGHWASAEILKLQSLGILSGYPDRTFRPDELVNHYQIARVVAALRNADVDQADLSVLVKLPDADQIPAWARPYVALGLSGGYMQAGDVGFLGVAVVTRAQMAQIIGKLLPDQDGPSPMFTDAAAIPVWARTGAAKAATAHVMTGFPDGHFGPDEPLTRAQMASILARLVDRLGVSQ